MTEEQKALMKQVSYSKDHGGEPEPLPMDMAVNTLQHMVRDYASVAEHLSVPHQKTFSIPVEPVDPLLWLHHQDHYPKLFWSNREKNDIVAGIGKADTIEFDTTGPNSQSFNTLQRKLAEKDPGTRFFGGFSFNNQEQQDRQWHAFKSFLFILPEVQLSVVNDIHSLSCSLVTKPEEPAEKQSRRILELLGTICTVTDSAPRNLPDLRSTTFLPDRKQWLETCGQILECFEEGLMGKIILARQTLLEFEEAFPPLLFLLNFPYPESSVFRYHFEPEKNTAFFSFTPERLYRRNGDELLTEALAGTCSMQTIEEGNVDACKQLLNSEKDIREHKFVRDTIAKELEPICSSIDMEEDVQALQLNRLVHLYTQCRAILNPESCNDKAVLNALHPTPAVGGVPRNKALEEIIHLEPFSRGWYAAPIGWISGSSAEFAVGIRSAVASEKKLYVYSGAGLVRGSNPAAEWEEVDQKIADILAITRQKA